MGLFEDEEVPRYLVSCPPGTPFRSTCVKHLLPSTLLGKLLGYLLRIAHGSLHRDAVASIYR